jgi:hypothetical protein
MIGSVAAASGEHPLFRTLVVCGASLVGLSCGGRTAADDQPGAGATGVPEPESGRGGTRGAGGRDGKGGTDAVNSAETLCPAACASPAQFFCDDFKAGTNCRCNPDAPRTSKECAVHWDFHCASAAAPSRCTGSIAVGPTFGCRCSRELRPEDCKHTAHFRCDQYQRVALGCRCDPTAPSKPEDCTPPARFSCSEASPPIGCNCVELVPIR